MKIVIVLLAVLLAGGGGFGAGWYLFGRHPEPAAANAGTPPPPPPPPPEPTGPPQFVTVGPITVPVLTSDRVDQFVTLGVALELGDASTAEKVKQQAPRLT